MLMLKLRPSKILAILLVAMHFLALASVWLVSLPIGSKLAISLVFGLSLAYAFYRNFGKQVCRDLRLDEQCSLTVLRGENLWQEAIVQPSTFVSPYLTVLNFRLSDEKTVRHVVIFPDSIDAEQFRQLRVLLRWKCPQKMA